MKKRIEFCLRCRKETTHRYKNKSYSEKKKDESYKTYPLLVKCMTCGYKKGTYIKEKIQKRRHVKI